MEKRVEYAKVSRGSVDKILDVWGTAGWRSNTFFFERVGEDDLEGYSYLIDSGTTIYKVEVGSTGVSDEVALKITKFQQ